MGVLKERLALATGILAYTVRCSPVPIRLIAADPDVR
jgi:hypothetical protein